MNAITSVERAVALSIPRDIAFEEWIGIGKDLFIRQRQTEWLLADWLNVGSDKFRDLPQMAMFLEEIGVDPKRALADAKVARLIPPTWRSDKVSFNVCRQIAKIDDEPTRLRMLKQAVDERWNEKAAHHHVVEHMVETGSLLPEDDPDTRQAVEGIRCWNRMSKAARAYLAPLIDMAAANNFGPIDEDVAI